MQDIERTIFNSFLKSDLIPFLIIIITFSVVTLIIKTVIYKRTTYYKETGISYLKVRTDSGRFGEYLVYKYLSVLEKDGCKFLFNVYLPKENNETTELDVIAICKNAVFVFESKNYSGWIFGDENQKMWTQVLPEGKGKSRKEHFYNPIFQNRTHIKYLKSVIGDDVPVHSVIVFSERCTLKKLTVSDDVNVIRRNHVLWTVKKILEMSSEIADPESLYNILKPYTEVSDEEKKKHIENIKSKNFR